MNIHRYWAWKDVEANGPDGRAFCFTVRRGSDLSEEDAARRADDAARDLAARVRSGGPPPKWYEYSMRQLPEPILEEFHDDAGARLGAITINRFGCEVLNTQQLAFLDIDLVPARRRGVFLSRLFGGGHGARGEEPGASPAEGAIDQLRAWVSEHPGTSVRVYRTTAGLRYLFVSPSMQPRDALHEPVYEQLGCDRLYRRLCVAQNCFRARLSPKPWRIGVEGSPAWRVDRLEASPEEYERWHRGYLERARGFAACEFVETVGEVHEPDASVRRMIDVHDERAGVGTGLPLA